MNSVFPTTFVLIIFSLYTVNLQTVPTTLVLDADDTYEAYFDMTELLPQNYSLANCTNSTFWYPSRYCCIPGASAISIQGPRCDFVLSESYRVNISSQGSLLAVKYINSIYGGVPNAIYDFDLPIFDICTQLINPSGFMAEFLDSYEGEIKVNWVCTGGNDSTVIDTENNRNWISTEYNDSHWIPSLFAGFNVPRAWSNISLANPDPNMTFCYGPPGNNVWYYDCGGPIGGFTNSGYWQYNIFPGISFAYCRGKVTYIPRNDSSIVYIEESINVTSSQNFTFQGIQLIITGNLQFEPGSTGILNPGQTVNVQHCITFSGNLLLYVQNISEFQQSVTPFKYNYCKYGQFNAIQVQVTDNSPKEGCQVTNTAVYGTKSLVVLYEALCDSSSDGGESDTWIIAVSVTVGAVGIGVVVIIIVGIILVVMFRKRKKKISKVGTLNI